LSANQDHRNEALKKPCTIQAQLLSTARLRKLTGYLKDVHQVNSLFYQKYKSHLSKVENLNLLASKIIKITKKHEL
jgi:hypothetical protein